MRWLNVRKKSLNYTLTCYKLECSTKMSDVYTISNTYSDVEYYRTE